MNCHNAPNGCRDQVWWSARRSQWVHEDTGRAICAIEHVTTLTASPADDVRPSAASRPAKDGQGQPRLARVKNA